MVGTDHLQLVLNCQVQEGDTHWDQNDADHVLNEEHVRIRFLLLFLCATSICHTNDSHGYDIAKDKKECGVGVYLYELDD